MSSTIDLIKSVWDLIEKSKDAALKEAFIDLRLKVIEVQEENAALREQVMELQKRLQREETKLAWDGKFYWDRTAPQGSEQGPFCQKCCDDDQKKVRLQEGDIGFTCRVCGTFYQTKPHPPMNFGGSPLA